MEVLKVLEDKLAGDLYGLNLGEKTMEEKATYAQILVTLKQLHEKSHAEAMAEALRNSGQGFCETRVTEGTKNG